MKEYPQAVYEVDTNEGMAFLVPFENKKLSDIQGRMQIGVEFSEIPPEVLSLFALEMKSVADVQSLLRSLPPEVRSRIDTRNFWSRFVEKRYPKEIRNQFATVLDPPFERGEERSKRMAKSGRAGDWSPDPKWMAIAIEAVESAKNLQHPTFVNKLGFEISFYEEPGEVHYFYIDRTKDDPKKAYRVAGDNTLDRIAPFSANENNGLIRYQIQRWLGTVSRNIRIELARAWLRGFAYYLLRQGYRWKPDNKRQPISGLEEW